MSIRPATLEDLPWLVDQGVAFLSTTGYAAALPPAPAAIARTMTALVESPEAAVLVLEDAAGARQGAIGLMLSVHLWTGERYAGELFWWVTPGARGGGLRLLRAGERWAQDRGARFLQMVAPTAQVGRVYERFGYAWLEAGYQRRF